MVKYIDAEKLKTEIERRWKNYRNSVTPDQPKYRTHYFVGKGEVCEELLSFLSTLEEPVSEELEEEIDRLWESFADEMEGPHNLFDIYARLARHFAQWGAEHLNK